MQVTDNLMPVIASPANLLQAWRAIRSNVPKYRRKKCVGPDGISLLDFEEDLQCQLSVLRYRLMKGKYHPTQPVFFDLPKKAGGIRRIAVLSIADRVAQRAVQQVIEPFWEEVFLDCSFGYRPGLGVEDALKRVLRLRNLGNAWVVNGDIDGFFDHLDQGLLLRYLSRKVKDRRVIGLVASWLDVGTVQSELSEGEPRPPEPLLSAPLSWLEEQVDRKGQQSAEGDGMSGDARFGDFSEGQRTDGFAPNILVKQTLRQAAAGGLMAVSGFARPLAQQSVGFLRNALLTPGFRKKMLQVLLGTGCVAVAGAAVAGYLLCNRSAPARRGILQGSPLSPLLANVYLHPFDRKLSRKGYHLVRYADDWLLLTGTEDQALQGYNDAVIALAGLRLRINDQKTSVISPQEDFTWLGKDVSATASSRSRLAR